MPFLEEPERRLNMSAWLKDTLERAGWTAVQGALGTASIEALAAGDLSAWRAAAVGGLAAVISLVKSTAARKVGDPDSAATLWTASQPPR